MIPVYFSHVGEVPLLGVTEPELVKPGKVRDILAEIESRHPGLCKVILDAMVGYSTRLPYSLNGLM